MPRYCRQCRRRAIASALLPRCPPPPPCCHASIATAVAVLPMPPPTPSTSPQPVHPLAALSLALALATTPASGDRRHRRQPLSPITIVVVAAVAAAANAAATTPSPLPPPSLLLQPLSMSLRLQRFCRWLVVVSSVALAYCVVCHPNLSAPAIVPSLTLSPTGRRPLLLTIANHCPIALLPRINCFRRSR
jgi:hypothetical protein